MLDLIFKTLYLMLPGIFANMAPVLFKNYFKSLAIPIDFNKTWKGKPILGSHKTFRGFITGIILATAVAYIQAYLYNYDSFERISLLNYSRYNPLVIGFLMGFGVLFGDAVKSFFKRRANIAPGKPFVPWDQLDSVLGGLLVFSLVYIPPWSVILTSVVLTFLLSILLGHIAYWLGFRKEKW